MVVLGFITGLRMNAIRTCRHPKYGSFCTAFFCRQFGTEIRDANQHSRCFCTPALPTFRRIVKVSLMELRRFAMSSIHDVSRRNAHLPTSWPVSPGVNWISVFLPFFMSSDLTFISSILRPCVTSMLRNTKTTGWPLFRVFTSGSQVNLFAMISIRRVTRHGPSVGYRREI
jgi:hypothetical protein